MESVIMKEFPLLKTGMFVVNEHDEIGVVVNDTVVYQHNGFDETVALYHETICGGKYVKYVFSAEEDRCFDDIKEFMKDITSPYAQENLIWSSVKFVTMEDVKKKFGCEVVIIDKEVK